MVDQDTSKQSRRRTKTKRFDFEFLDNEDQRLLQQVRTSRFNGDNFVIVLKSFAQSLIGLKNILP